MPTPDPQILTTVTEIVAAELGMPAGAVDPDADLRAIEGADSVKVLRMIAKIEREYDLELDDEDVFGVSCVRDVAEVVRRALATVDAA